MSLDKGDFVYIDALSNQLFMGSDENGFPTEPERDGVGNWHILGSLVAAPKPRLKKLLHQLVPLRDACTNVTLVCGLPLGRYISGKCCRDETHLENRGDKNFGQILVSAIASCRGCLEAAFPGCIVFNPTDRIWRACSARLACPSGRRATRSTSPMLPTATSREAWSRWYQLQPPTLLRTCCGGPHWNRLSLNPGRRQPPT